MENPIEEQIVVHEPPSGPPPEDVVPPNYDGPVWGTWTKRVVIVLLIVGALYATTLLVPVINILMLSLVVTFLLFAPSRSLTRHLRMPYTLSVVLVYMALIGLLFLVSTIFVPSLVRWTDSLLVNLERSYGALYNRFLDYDPEVDGVIEILGTSVSVDFLIEPVRDLVLNAPVITSNGDTPREDAPALRPGASPTIDLRATLESMISVAGAVTGTVTSAVTGAIGFVVQVILVLFLSFLILLEVPRMYRAVIELTPDSYRREYGLLAERVLAVWNGFFRGQVIIGLIIGVFTWLQMRVMGVPGAEVVGVFTGIVSLIPTLGGFIALPVLFIVPLLQGSSVLVDLSNGTLALLLVGINLGFQQLIWNVLAPAIVGQAVNLPLPVIILGLFIGAAFGGILGAFLVAPIMGTLRVLLIYTFNKLKGVDPYPNREGSQLTEAMLTGGEALAVKESD